MTELLALYTFGIFMKPSAHADNAGFHQRNDVIFGLIDHAAGFVARSGYDGDPGPPSWGTQVYPRFYVERGDGYSPSTLSLWTDAESAMAFAYAGLHGEAFRLGRQWMVKPEWPPYVAWWVAADHRPDWAEGVARLERLHAEGPTATAFDFKRAFDAGGRAVPVDRIRIKAIAAENEARFSAASASHGAREPGAA